MRLKSEDQWQLKLGFGVMVSHDGAHLVISTFDIVDEEAQIGDRDARVLKNVLFCGDNAAVGGVVGDDLEGALRARHAAKATRNERRPPPRRFVQRRHPRLHVRLTRQPRRLTMTRRAV